MMCHGGEAEEPPAAEVELSLGHERRLDVSEGGDGRMKEVGGVLSRSKTGTRRVPRWHDVM
jgi:hypothetical protein